MHAGRAAGSLAALSAAALGSGWESRRAATAVSTSRPRADRPFTVSSSLAALERRVGAVEAVHVEAKRRVGALSQRLSAIESSETVEATAAAAAAAASHSVAVDVHDVVIVGGGIVGAALALQLGLRAREVGQPIRVALLEAQEVGSGSSGLSAGTIWAVGTGDGSSAVATVCDETMLMLKHVEALGFDCELEESGALTLGCTAAEAAMLRADATTKAAHGYIAELLDGAEAVASVEPVLRGGSVLAALHTPRSGHVEPMVATHAIVEAALAVGGGAHSCWGACDAANAVEVSVAERARVQALRQREAPNGVAGGVASSVAGSVTSRPQRLWEVSVADREEPLLAKHVVLAAGTAVAELGRNVGLRIPVSAVKGLVWAGAPSEQKEGGCGEEEAAAAPLRKVIFVAEAHEFFKRLRAKGAEALGGTAADDALPANVTHDAAGRARVRHAYGRPRRDGSVIFGGARIPLAAGAEKVPGVCAVDAEGERILAANRVHVAEFFPGASTLEDAGAWGGVMPFSLDGPPLVGSLAVAQQGDASRLDGLWLAAGFGPHGIMEGPGAMKFLAEEIVDGLRGFCEAGGSVEGQRRARVLAFYDPYRAQGVQVQHRSE